MSIAERLWHGVSAFLIALIVFCLIVIEGCGVSGSYVDADRLTYEAITPAYLRYTEEDKELEKADQERRRRLVRSWDARIKEAEGAR